MFEEFDSFRKKDEGRSAMKVFINDKDPTVGDFGIDLAWELYKLRELLHVIQLQDAAIPPPPKAHKIDYQTKC